jgi:hypothetical protein
MFLSEPLESTLKKSKILSKIKQNKFFIFIACSKVLQVASAGLFVEIKYHEPLFSVIQYLSECTIYGRGARIGGIQHTDDPSTSTICFPFEIILSYIYIFR